MFLIKTNSKYFITFVRVKRLDISFAIVKYYQVCYMVKMGGLYEDVGLLDFFHDKDALHRVEHGQLTQTVGDKQPI